MKIRMVLATSHTLLPVLPVLLAMAGLLGCATGQGRGAKAGAAAPGRPGNAGSSCPCRERKPGQDATPAPAAAPASAIPVTAADPAWGNPDAPVTIVEFSDFQCPFCSRVGDTLDGLKRLYGPNQLRRVWKNYPLPFHQNARPASEAAMAVFAVGGAEAFWRFHDLVFANQRELSAENYLRWAAMVGVDGPKFEAELSSRRQAAKVDHDLGLATRLGIRGTPVFRINGVPLMGAQPLEAFKEIIDGQLAAAQALVASGTPAGQIYDVLSAKNADAVPAVVPKAAPAPEPEDTAIWRVPVEKSDPTRGPADALVTLVMFGDFQCPYSQRITPTIAQLEQRFPGRLRLVWRNYPMPFHDNAALAAEAAQEVFAQKGAPTFWEYHDLLFAAQAKGGLERPNLERLAQKVGVDMKRFRAALDGRVHQAGVDKDIAAAKNADLDGTPFFVINGYIVSGVRPFSVFEQVVARALAEAESARAADARP